MSDKVFNRNLRLGGSGFIIHDGEVKTINGQDVRILEKDRSGDILKATGTVTITDGASGYAKGCYYIDTDVASGTSCVYENVGTNTSSNFDLIAGTAGGGGGAIGLDSSYSLADNSITVDEGPITLTDATT